MNNFKKYSHHLHPYINTSSTIFINGDFVSDLPKKITSLLGNSVKVVYNLQGELTPNVTIDFCGFTENFWSVSSHGLYICSIEDPELIFDYSKLIEKDKITNFINSTSYIHQYDNFLVIEKRPSPRVISGSRKIDLNFLGN